MNEACSACVSQAALVPYLIWAAALNGFAIVAYSTYLVIRSCERAKNQGPHSPLRPPYDPGPRSPRPPSWAWIKSRTGTIFAAQEREILFAKDPGGDRVELMLSLAWWRGSCFGVVAPAATRKRLTIELVVDPPHDTQVSDGTELSAAEARGLAASLLTAADRVESGRPSA